MDLFVCKRNRLISSINHSLTKLPSTVVIMSFLGLPNEILREIITYIRGIGDLHRLATCSQHLNGLSEPFLYSHFFYHGDVRPLRPLEQFIESLIILPRRANYVNELTLISSEKDVTRSSSSRVVRRAIKSANLEQDDKVVWLRDLDAGGDNAMIALLLMITPSLRALFLTVDFRHERYMKNLRRGTLLWKDGPHLGHLTEVSLGTRCAPIHVLQTYLTLPCLQKLYTYWIEDGSGNWDIPARISPITELELLYCSLSAKSISEILLSTKSLRVFRYLHIYAGGLDALFHAEAYGDAIAIVKHSLEVLELLENMPSEKIEASIGSLTDYPMLREICVSADLLLQPDRTGTLRSLVDLVPPSLEDLQLKHCNDMDALLPQLKELISQKASRSPSLKRIGLSWSGRTVRNLKKDIRFKQLQSQCRAASISLERT